MTVRVTFARQSSQLLARSGPGPGGQRTFAYNVLLMMPLQPFPWPQRTLLLRPIVGVTVPVAVERGVDSLPVFFAFRLSGP